MNVARIITRVAVCWLVVSVVAGVLIGRLIAVGDHYRDIEGDGPL